MVLTLRKSKLTEIHYAHVAQREALREGGEKKRICLIKMAFQNQNNFLSIYAEKGQKSFFHLSL